MTAAAKAPTEAFHVCEVARHRGEENADNRITASLVIGDQRYGDAIRVVIEEMIPGAPIYLDAVTAAALLQILGEQCDLLDEIEILKAKS